MQHHQYVAFLRAMNTGRRRIKNDALCQVFEDMGFTDVSAYQASGNVIFKSNETDAIHIESSIESGLKKSLGYEVPTFLRTAREVQDIAAHEPFKNTPTSPTGKMQVVFFKTPQNHSTRQAILAHSTDDDRLEFTDRQLYWLPKASISTSNLDLKSIERTLGSMTIRTKATIERIAAKLLG